ncbi:hypothetical protein DW958_06025 [Ruminococcus sp. AM46-18]|jgi:hypothetical protein|nr:hypothetical protein DW958_06025 [Ruminococcus sp. AM46-18]
MERGDTVIVPRKPGRPGRPVEPEAKRHDIKVRVDDKMYNNLVAYSKQYKLTKAEVIRKSLDKFLAESGNN